MRLRAISLQTTYNHIHQLKFNSQAWCIQEMYWYVLNSLKYDTGSYHKAIIVLGENVEDNKVTDMVDVIKIEYNFSLDDFFAKKDFDKKTTLLKNLHRGMNELASQKNWDTDALEQAYNNSLDRKLNNEWLLKNKYFRSPNHKKYAAILCSWQLDKFEAYVIFCNKNKEELKRVKLFEEKPFLADYVYWSKPRWENNEEFVLESRENTWKVQI